MDSDVCIVGGGLVGGTLALALSGIGLQVALIDGATRPTQSSQPFDLRVFALRPGSIDFLARCGVWPRLSPSRVADVQRMIVHGDDGESVLAFDAYRSGMPRLAAIVEDSSLQSALQACLAEAPMVQRLAGRSCVGAEWSAQAVAVTLDDGTTIESALVVAADGADSRLRALAGIEVHAKEYGQLGVVANFRAAEAHRDTACQWFCEDGVLALLPLPDQHVSMVWSAPEPHARALLAMTAAELAETVTRKSGSALGVLSALGPARAFPLRRLRAESIVGARVALVGDAAHNVHPLAGQGLNLGLADAQALAEVLAGRGPGEDPGCRALLARYRRARAEEIASMTWVTDGLHSLFASGLPGMSWLRNAGLRITDRLPPLKHALVKRAAG